MQLGELQNQIERFARRDVTVIVLSVDAPDDSLAMIERLGLTFTLGSDPDQNVVKAFRVQNPDTKELALHAVYIVDPEGKVFYRKVASRRPTSAELIDAVDAFRGVYPQHDDVNKTRARIAVAYPQNNFQALIEMSSVEAPPETVDGVGLQAVKALMQAGQSDDSLIAFKHLVVSSNNATREDLYQAAAYLARSVFVDDKQEAISLGLDLSKRLKRVRELNDARQAAPNPERQDELVHLLARARAGLSLTRAKISKNADAWNLRFAKGTLRGYREVARAGTRVPE